MAERRPWAQIHPQGLPNPAHLAPGNPAWELNGSRYHPVRQFRLTAVFPRLHKSEKVKEAEAVSAHLRLVQVEAVQWEAVRRSK